MIFPPVVCRSASEVQLQEPNCCWIVILIVQEETFIYLRIIDCIWFKWIFFGLISVHCLVSSHFCEWDKGTVQKKYKHPCSICHSGLIKKCILKPQSQSILFLSIKRKTKVLKPLLTQASCLRKIPQATRLIFSYLQAKQLLV